VASSGLSSVPSDIFTPRLGSNPAERDTASQASRDIPAVFQGKKKARTSHIWSSENGCEIEVDGIRRWRCNRCKLELLPRLNRLRSTADDCRQRRTWLTTVDRSRSSSCHPTDCQFWSSPRTGPQNVVQFGSERGLDRTDRVEH
jgi:hypothetical protein